MKWNICKNIEETSPSRIDGVNYLKEMYYRQQSAHLIQEMGELLKMSQLSVNTAITYFHRFYAVQSFKKFDRFAFACASLLLSSKVEENIRRLDDIISVKKKLTHLNNGKVEIEKRNVLAAEEILLLNLCNKSVETLKTFNLAYDIIISHPNTFVLSLKNQMIKTDTYDKKYDNLFCLAYVIATNSMLQTTMCIEYTTPEISCACLNLSRQWMAFDFPIDQVPLRLKEMREDYDMWNIDEVTNRLVLVFSLNVEKYLRTVSPEEQNISSDSFQNRELNHQEQILILNLYEEGKSLREIDTNMEILTLEKENYINRFQIYHPNISTHVKPAIDDFFTKLNEIIDSNAKIPDMENMIYKFLNKIIQIQYNNVLKSYFEVYFGNGVNIDTKLCYPSSFENYIDSVNFEKPIQHLAKAIWSIKIARYSIEDFLKFYDKNFNILSNDENSCFNAYLSVNTDQNNIDCVITFSGKNKLIKTNIIDCHNMGIKCDNSFQHLVNLISQIIQFNQDISIPNILNSLWWVLSNQIIQTRMYATNFVYMTYTICNIQYDGILPEISQSEMNKNYKDINQDENHISIQSSKIDELKFYYTKLMKTMQNFIQFSFTDSKESIKWQNRGATGPSAPLESAPDVIYMILKKEQYFMKYYNSSYEVNNLGIGKIKKNGTEHVDIVLDQTDYLNAKRKKRKSEIQIIDRNNYTVQLKNEIYLPKTFSTRTGALLLYSEDCINNNILKGSETSEKKYAGVLGIKTMNDFLISILKYGSTNNFLTLVVKQKNQQNVRPGYSAKRYMGKLIKSMNDTSIMRLASNGKSDIKYFVPKMGTG
ncbi:hypothetical protein A3Q56_01772 [Intoshia linei]|uniref:Cyclin-like domain-containing protein n=1 Tax=Intoshia linei TaxID=1819745 RepID=A0A177BAK1_9BILA|nr:hypothetical protein A3Q56_01772 [Intoshia linei]